MCEAKTKICGACRERKPTSSFHKNCRVKDGFSLYCKKCIKARLCTGHLNGHLEPSSSPSLMDDALNSCLERLGDIESNIASEKASGEAVKAAMIDIIRANKLEVGKTYKHLPNGSFRYYKGILHLRLKP